MGDATLRAPTLPDAAHDITSDSSNEWQLLDANAETLGVGDTQTTGLVALKPGSRTPASGDDAGNTQQLDPPSMSEIGTKLDLARAYIDMGDPDGARSILAEVLAEGSDAQKQEAQRLLDGIPG
jgi:FimV-like protein